MSDCDCFGPDLHFLSSPRRYESACLRWVFPKNPVFCQSEQKQRQEFGEKANEISIDFDRALW
jgi:hypothetical protein